MATENKCPHCGKPVPTTAPGGICPECMLKAGLTETAEFGPGGTVVAKPGPHAAPRVEEIAPHFPQLEILECLGRGGMGVVYKARQPKLDRLVALKILSRTREGATRDAEFAERFQREARALARLSHPDIVAVYDFGEAGGFAYLLMEYVDGLTLRQLLQTRKLSPEEALAIVPKICEALQFAHARGIVHRDIKPENILLDKQGALKIADFGIAKIVGQHAEASLTQEKQVIGTPHYMAPEQIEKPATVDHRADIFSLGVVFYEMLTGELPLGKFQPPSRKVHVDVRLDEIVLHALEKEPDRRYQRISEVKTDVETVAAGAEGRKQKAELAGERAQSGAARDAVWLSTQLLPDWLPEERVRHFKQPLWAVFNQSWPTGRLFFSLPPLWSAGMYVTERRVLLLSHFLGIAQRFSLWFPGQAPDAQREILRNVTVGLSRLLGGFLELKSEDFKPRWWRSRELRIRVYLRQPELLQKEILAAQKNATLAMAPVVTARTQAADARAPQSPPAWLPGARWTARIAGTLLLALFGVFMLGEGLPPIGSQPEGVQFGFVALGLMWLGFIVGWKREGAAALLIAAGWTLWQISANSIRWDLFQIPLVVGLLYGGCWWATQGRRVGTVAVAVCALGLALVVGRAFLPTNIFIRGIVRDSQNGNPVPNAELSLPAREGGAKEKSQSPSARAGKDGRFTLYVGWFSEQTPVTISASGYETLTTPLGPRPPNRNMLRDFHLRSVDSVPTAAKAPPVVIETVPASGAAEVDPAITELRVTFSKPMRDGNWSWAKLDDASYPEMTGGPRYTEDRQTCVLPVKLQPGRVYATWINVDQFQNFQDESGQPVVPYLLIFETRK